MDEQISFYEGNTHLPSQLHFGNQEILFFSSPQSQSRPSQFRRLNFHTQYDSKRWLCEKISEQTYQLTQQLKSSQFSQYQCLAYSLHRILKHIVDDADKEGMLLEHKILYLTFKYLLLLICQKASLKNQPIEESVNIHQWLFDIDSLFFKPSFLASLAQDQGSQDELIECLKKKDYESMIVSLRLMGAKEKDEQRRRKIELIIKMLVLKIDNLENEMICGKSKDIRMANKITMEACLREFQETFKEKGKKKGQKDSRDTLDIICEVLLGNFEYIQMLVKDSWPLFLTHIIDMQLDETDSYEKLKDQAISFLKFKRNTVLNLSAEMQYLFDLLSGKNLHTIYQSLFDLVAPYYSHVISYYFYYFYEATPLLVTMKEDYVTDLIRNMLDHSAQVSYICLFLTFAFLEGNELVNKRADMFEPLLFYHLSVVDIDDKSEIQLFLNKINLLSTLNLQKYGHSHVRTLFQTLIKENRLNESVVQIFLTILSVYGRFVNYEQEIIAYIDRYFTQFSIERAELETILNLKESIQGKKKYRKQFREINKLLPSFEKFALLERAKNETQEDTKLRLIIQLMRMTLQSLPFVRLIKQTILAYQLTNKSSTIEYSIDQLRLRNMFLISVKRFLAHYPQSHSLQQSAILQEIDVSLQ